MRDHMTLRRAAGTTILALVLSAVASTVALQPASGRTSDELRVGSFNLFGVNNDSKASGDRKVWRERRPKVVSQILAQGLDVVGLQEANQSSTYASRLDYGTTQFNDVLGAINAQGGNYALTDTDSYNCVNPKSTYKCVYKDQDASGGTRIIYDKDTVSLVRQGATTYKNVTEGKPQRFLTWAVFTQKSTGKQFLFTNTHLDPYTVAARTAQWDEAIALVNSLKGSLPVVSVGDFNTSKFSDYAATYVPRMRSNGYGDAVNQEPGRNTLITPRAESTYRGWVNSYNGFRRDIRPWAYEEARSTKIGNGIDWVFASKAIRVKSWEVVIDVDPTTLQLRGVIPSDHNLVRATLVLP